MVKKEKNKVGRPSVITDTVLAKLEQAYKVGANDTEACEYAEIDPATLYRYFKKNKEFCEKKTAWKSRPTLKAKFSAYKGLDDPRFALDYLKLRDNDFSNKLEQKITNLTPQIVVANQADADILQRIANVKPNTDVL